MVDLKTSENIRKMRKERELTQEELANMLGVTKAAVSKWENAESYPDISLLPQIAHIFDITIDDLIGHVPDNKHHEIINQYCFGLSLDDVDREILNHGIVKSSSIVKTKRLIGDKVEDAWEVRVQILSIENDFPYTLQKFVRPGVLIDGYSVRLVNGKVIDDDRPNKHYVCSEKVWDYKNTDMKYLRQMLKEQAAMGLIEEDE